MMTAMRNWMALAIAGALGAGASLAGAAEVDKPAMAGVWQATTHEARLIPSDGAALPFTAAGKVLYAKNQAGLKSGALVDRAVHLCLPQGMPRAMTTAYPMQIMLSPDDVVFAYEENRSSRIVAFTGQHADAEAWDPSFMGDGIAAWDGDTLVVDTTNFKSDKIYLDASGVPASEQLRVVERLRLLDGGRRLEDQITITDPAIFSRPWTSKRVFARRDDVELRTDWVCGEAHRDVSAVMKGAKK